MILELRRAEGSVSVGAVLPAVAGHGLFAEAGVKAHLLS